MIILPKTNIRPDSAMNLAFGLEAFPNAEGIIWHKFIRMITPDTFEMTIISSEYWLEDFAAPESFKAVFVVEEEEV